jgi:prepilin-type N-terminal cleavage/methylation domain-containing protein
LTFEKNKSFVDFKLAHTLGTAMKRKHEKGFTLVELVITIVLIGILTAVMMALYKPFSEASEIAACKQNQMHIETAQAVFYMDKYLEHDGHYATTIEELGPYFPNGKLPKCPTNSNYRLLANGVAECEEPKHQR